MQVRTNQWNQLGGNATGSGFRLVNSIPVNALRWISDLGGPVNTQSTVIGPDGTLFTGTDRGELFATLPAHGDIKWRRMIGGPRLSVLTPAVADDGTIYCLLTPPPTLRDHRTSGERGFPSFVVAINADGTERWRVPIRTVPDIAGTVHPNRILGAPRIVSGPQGRARVVFVLRYEPLDFYAAVGNLPTYLQVLAMVDENGSFLLFNRYELERIFIEVTGGGGIGGGATLENPPERGLKKADQPCQDMPVVSGRFPAREPWAIVANGRQGLYLFRWNDQDRALAAAPKLFKLRTAFPAPAAFVNGLLIGNAANSVTLLDADSFTPYVPNATSIGAQSTAAGGLRQMYFATRYGHLTAVDTNGSVWKQQQLEAGSIAIPALTANHIHVSTAKGLETYTLDLEKVATYQNTSAGRSSPAIDADGNVYLAAGKTLYAYFYVARTSGRGMALKNRLKKRPKKAGARKKARKKKPAKRPAAKRTAVKRRSVKRTAKQTQSKRSRGRKTR